MYTLEESKCPYCNNCLNPAPRRKTKCKVCGNHFYVKTRLPDRVKVIVTEKERDSIEKDWEEHWRKRSFLDSIFSSGIISEEEFQEAKNLFLSKGQNISDRDISWGLFNKKLMSYMKQTDWESMGRVYYEMAVFLHKEGKNCFRLLQESTKCRLRSYKEQGVENVSITTAGPNNSCKHCLKLEGKTFTVEEALNIMPIPVKDCSTEVFVEGEGFCRCIYLSEVR